MGRQLNFGDADPEGWRVVVDDTECARRLQSAIDARDRPGLGFWEGDIAAAIVAWMVGVE